MRAVQHQGPAQTAPVQQGLQPPVLGVVAAHEADLRQPAAERRLGLHDPQGTGGVRHHGLLAQHGQPAGEGGEQRLLVRGAGGGDQDGRHTGRVERGHRVRVHADPVEPGHR